MTQAITTFISTEETEVPPAHHTEEGATQRGRESSCTSVPQDLTPGTTVTTVLCLPRGAERVPWTEADAVFFRSC